MSKASKDRPRLGRGLSSLIPNVSYVDLPEEVVPEEPAPIIELGPASPPPPASGIELPLERIFPNPHQPRRQFKDASLAELAASIKSTGLIQPVIVRQVGDAYELIAGERRWRAAKLAGLEAIPAIIRQVDGFTQAQMALVENIQREDLNPLDRARAYQALMQQLGLTQQELASRLGEDRSSIANHLRLLELAPAVQAHVEAGSITLGHAKVLAGLADRAGQERFAKMAVDLGLSVRALETAIETNTLPIPPPLAPPPPSPTAHLFDLEQSLSRQLGLRVQVRPSGTKG